MKKLLYITNNINLEENINPDYTYTTPDMLKRYLEQKCIKRKFWTDSGSGIKYSVVNGDCFFIINEIRLRHNFKTYESFKRNIDNYKYITTKDKYERKINRYEKKKNDIKTLIEIIKEKEEDIQILEDNKLNIDTIIEEKIKHKLNNVVIKPTSNFVSNQDRINHLRNNIIGRNCNNDNPYSSIKF